MKIKLHLATAILVSTVLITACEKGGSDNYVKAKINGNSWNTSSVSVETMGSGSGTEPWKITGSLNGEEISIRLPGQNPGNYPFRQDDHSYQQEHYQQGDNKYSGRQSWDKGGTKAGQILHGFLFQDII